MVPKRAHDPVFLGSASSNQPPNIWKNHGVWNKNTDVSITVQISDLDFGGHFASGSTLGSPNSRWCAMLPPWCSWEIYKATLHTDLLTLQKSTRGNWFYTIYTVDDFLIKALSIGDYMGLSIATLVSRSTPPFKCTDLVLYGQKPHMPHKFREIPWTNLWTKKLRLRSHIRSRLFLTVV